MLKINLLILYIYSRYFNINIIVPSAMYISSKRHFVLEHCKSVNSLCNTFFQKHPFLFALMFCNVNCCLQICYCTKCVSLRKHKLTLALLHSTGQTSVQMLLSVRRATFVSQVRLTQPHYTLYEAPGNEQRYNTFNIHRRSVLSIFMTRDIAVSILKKEGPSNTVLILPFQLLSKCGSQMGLQQFFVLSTD